jgi:hypothetical protein
MRAFARLLINLAFLAGTAAALGWATTLKAYHQASTNMRIAILVTILVVMFALACIVLAKVIPAKKSSAKPSPGSYAYTAPAKRGR